ncbi:hypothetical protein [Massilia sp. S19_KUP03_FR1]|uniref:hypothetical protein n=1 Tax=Massilia sp. S19_KUP03_FR1 TaxID=3025503 RepID=UPI002FCD16D1
MLTTIIKSLFCGVLRVGFLLRLQRWPASLLVQWRCARRIDAMTHRLLCMRAKIRALSGHLMSGALRGALDPDGTLALMLADLKEETRTLRYQLAQWHVKECKGRAGMRLKASMLVLNRIAAETYAAADRLAWDILEHDARLPG